MKYLSVVIPAFNESANLKSGVLEEVHDYLKKQSYEYEVLIVDDGSTDNTVELIEQKIRDKKNFKLIQNSHGGKAITVITGLLVASGEIALFTDMDQATPLKEIEKFFNKFEGGYDIVIGTRQGRKGAPLQRKLQAWGFALYRNVVLGLPFSDTQCGFKAFNKKSRETIFGRLKQTWKRLKVQDAHVNAGFDVEVLYLAKKLKFKVAEVSVEWHHAESKRVEFIKDSLDAVWEVLKIRINELAGKYD